MFEFLTKPRIVVEGVRRLGVKGAVTHGLRHASSAAGVTAFGPFQLRINPTDFLCNHACPMCALQFMPELHKEKKLEREQWLQLADYRRLFDEMPRGLTEVNLVGGGEPMAHPDTVAIMQEVRDRDMRGYLMTNGTLMKEDIARSMIAMGWNRTRCSVHAGDPDTYKAIHGVDKFAILERNMMAYNRLRQEAGVSDSCLLTIVNVLQRENIHTINEMFEFAERVGADHVEFELIVPLAKHQLLTLEELKYVKATMERCAGDFKLSSNQERFSQKLLKEADYGRDDEVYRPAKRCSVGYDSAFIRAQGDVMPCCFSDEIMGNLREQTFSEIWHGPVYNEFRRRLMDGRFAGYCSSNRCKYETFLHN